ncbi:MAG: MarR family EPS-associated transcriptional regulator [Thermodesulfovibrionales bacterium]
MDESLFRILQQLDKDGTLSQRELSARMGMSLGKVNYIVNALLRQGLIKARRFKNAKNKIAYMYVLTPSGLNEKISQTRHFLERKLIEYERLRRDIEALMDENEAARAGVARPDDFHAG